MRYSTAHMKSFVESRTHTKKDFEFIKQLDEYFRTGMGSNSDKIANFTKYIGTQDLRSFLGRYELFQKIIHVPGSIIECGVLHGGGLMAFAHFNSLFEPRNHTRKIVGFDTFSGFPQLSEGDKKAKSEFAKKSSMAVDSFEDLMKCIKLFESNKFISNIKQLELVRGDAVKTIPKYLKENPHIIVSLLYLDFDLYEPTKAALENFVPRMPKGGIIVFDELNAKYWTGETRALLDSFGINNFRLERFIFDAYRAYAVLE